MHPLLPGDIDKTQILSQVVWGGARSGVEPERVYLSPGGRSPCWSQSSLSTAPLYNTQFGHPAFASHVYTDLQQLALLLILFEVGEVNLNNLP